jgi:hypothetical protein
MKDTATDIIYSKARVSLPFKGPTLKDALDFGFSYIESEDHVVEYIVANSNVLKKIFGEVQDSKLKVEGDSIGQLWTAKLLLSDRLADSQLLFSNNTFSVVVNLNTNPNTEEI